MTNHEIMMALGHMQRECREAFGYAPPAEVDFIDYPAAGGSWCDECQCYHLDGNHFEEKYPVPHEGKR